MRFYRSIAVFSLLSTLVYGQTISGRVYNKKTFEPLQQSSLIIERMDNQNIDTVYTSSQGVFHYTFNTTQVKQASATPTGFTVASNYPNPFNSSTCIQFQIPASDKVQLTIYNCLGQIVDEQQDWLAVGSYSIQWLAHGPSGVYFYAIRFGRQTLSGKMVLLDYGVGKGLSYFARTGSAQKLQKTSTHTVKLIAEKFGFVPDTLQTVIAGGEQLELGLESVHDHAWMIDLHNDILEKMADDPTYHLQQEHLFNHTDLPRLQKGGVDVQFFAVWVDPALYSVNPWEQAVRLITLFKEEIADNRATMSQAFSYQDLMTAVSEQKIAAILGVEGGHVIENDVSRIKTLYDFGMRYMTITWNNSTSWAVSAKDARSATVGLSDFGKQVIEKLDSLGVLIDVSHVGKKTVADILATSKNPIIASHSGAYSVCPHYRNLTDEQILAISKRGGVIGVVFYPPFLAASGVATIQSVIRHIDYIVKLAGVDYVAVGSDFDGIERTPLQLTDVTHFPDLTMALLEHGYNREQVEKILGKNFLRVFNRVTMTR